MRADYDRDVSKLISSHHSQPLRPFAGPERRLKFQFSVERHSGWLDFHFLISAGRPVDLAQILIPDLCKPDLRRRRDEIWKSTCFEIFVGPADQSSYLEVNLCPSGDWNVYSFEGYRQGMKPARDAAEVLWQHTRVESGDHFSLSGRLISQAPAGSEVGALLGSTGLVLGAAAVLEYQTGEKEYWALAHAGEKPDFHLRESFRLPL